MTGGSLSLQTRSTLVEYLLRLLQLDPYNTDDNPLAQQIVLANRDELDAFLFAAR